MSLPPDPARTALRRNARAARRAFVEALSPAVRQGLEASLARQLAPALARARLVGSHAAVGAEIDPAAAETLVPGAVAFPRVRAGGGLSFHRADYAALVQDAHGIPAPPSGLPEVWPDLLLVPLLLFDAAGNRLGQGGGHYDRTLTLLRASGPILAIGIAWDCQEAPALVPAPWDAPLDAVATPSRFLAVSAAARNLA
jgi:5-formyltetrahydrofolate cyclo-ligase